MKAGSSSETRPQSNRAEQVQDMLDEICHFLVNDEEENSEDESVDDEITEEMPSKKPKTDLSTKPVKKLLKKSPPKTRQRKATSKVKDEAKSFKTHDNSSCFVCNVNCGDYDLLQEHFSCKQFFCRVCTEEFSNHSELEKHLLTTHIIHRCKGCTNVYFTKKDYLQHRKSSESCIKETYQCEVCDKVFWKKKYLRLHRAKAHSVGSLKCGICSKTFSLAHILTSHLKAVHPVFENIECNFCKKLFLGPENLKKHVKLKHVEPLENSTFICEVCSKVFTNENLYKQHFKTHDKTEVLCELCGKSAAGQAAMKLHKRHDHPKSRIYTCSLCPLQFDSYNKYSNHKRNYHKDPNKEQPAYCEICGKKFKSTTVLKRHLLIHSDERTFKCNICGASFKQQVALYTHSRTHSDVNNYSCFQCGMTFRWKQTFDKHVKKCHEHPHYLDLS